MLVAILVIVIGVSLSVYTLTNTAPNIRPRRVTIPEYDCAIGMPPSECAQLKITCGNGVIDPVEDCNNCPIDAGCASGLFCGKVNESQAYTCNTQAGLWGSHPAG